MTSTVLKRILPLVLVTILGACQNDPTPLLMIDDRQISLEDFQQEIKPLQAELVLLPEEHQKLLLHQALSQLIDQELLLTEANRRRISISEIEMQQALNALRGNYSAQEYRDILKNSGQNPEHWLQQLRIRLLSEKVTASITRGKIDISEHQIEEYYLQHRDDYHRPEQLQARQILLNKEEEAANLRIRLLAGEPFNQLAREYSLSPDRETGGDLGLFARGQLPPEFDEILFKLTPGRVSQPVKSPYGVHLFLVEKRLKPGVLPLADVKNDIRQTLQSAEEARLYSLWLQELREGTEVQIDWEQLDKLHFNRAE